MKDKQTAEEIRLQEEAEEKEWGTMEERGFCFDKNTKKMDEKGRKEVLKMANRSRIADRKRMIKAMEFIARQVNDEEVLEGWLMCGVADEDIKYADFDPSTMDDDDWYIQDDNFKDVMDCFLRTMVRAKKSGGLYCGGIVSSVDETKDVVNIIERIQALLDKYTQEIIHLEAMVVPVEMYYKNGVNNGRLETLKQIKDEIREFLRDKEENT